MDFIKSLYDYFRGKTTDGLQENRAESLKNEFLKYDKNEPVIDINPNRESFNIDAANDIMRIFFGDIDSHSRPHNEIHTDFFNLVQELHNQFADMQNFIFRDDPDPNMGNCLGCDGPATGESLRDYYLTVPPLGADPTENNSDKKDIVIPSFDTGGIMTNMDMPSNSMRPHFHQTQQMVSMSVGPDGVLEITKITKDSSGKTEKTVTKVDLGDNKK